MIYAFFRPSKFFQIKHPCITSIWRLSGKNPPAMQEIRVWPSGWKDPLEEEMVTYFRGYETIPWTEKPGRLHKGPQRVAARACWEVWCCLNSPVSKSWPPFWLLSPSITCPEFFVNGVLQCVLSIWGLSFNFFGIFVHVNTCECVCAFAAVNE